MNSNLSSTQDCQTPEDMEEEFTVRQKTSKKKRKRAEENEETRKRRKESAISNEAMILQSNISDNTSMGDEEEETDWNEHVNTGLSVARDAVSLGTQAVPFGFEVARTSTNFGFGIAHAVMDGLAYVSDAVVPESGHIFRGVSQVTSLAQDITMKGLEASEAITMRSLQLSNNIFDEFSVSHGGLLRICGMPFLTSNALVETLKVLKDHLGEVWKLGPPKVLEKLYVLSSLQKKFEPFPHEGVIEAENIEELERYMPLVAAMYGPKALKFFGSAYIPGTTIDAILTLFGEVTIIAQTDSSETYRPAYAILLDQKHKKLIVAFRGTLSISDTLSDLVCDPVPTEFCGEKGFAHKGFIECGVIMYETLTPIMTSVLEEYPDFEVVVCGHSLGAACATVVTMNWIENTNWKIKGYLYAPPCVLSENLAQHPRLMECVQNFIIGNDLVPRLGRSTSKDLTNQIELLINSDVSVEQMLSNGDFYQHLIGVCCQEEPKLYPVGQCHFVLECHDVPIIVPNTYFDKLLIHENMIDDHLPHQLLKRGSQI